eukprot:169211-Pelagomonas_calceolata.AAC.2
MHGWSNTAHNTDGDGATLQASCHAWMEPSCMDGTLQNGLRAHAQLQKDCNCVGGAALQNRLQVHAQLRFSRSFGWKCVIKEIRRRHAHIMGMLSSRASLHHAYIMSTPKSGACLYHGFAYIIAYIAYIIAYIIAWEHMYSTPTQGPCSSQQQRPNKRTQTGMQCTHMWNASGCRAVCEELHYKVPHKTAQEFDRKSLDLICSCLHCPPHRCSSPKWSAAILPSGTWHKYLLDVVVQHKGPSNPRLDTNTALRQKAQVPTGHGRTTQRTEQPTPGHQHSFQAQGTSTYRDVVVQHKGPGTPRLVTSPPCRLCLDLGGTCVHLQRTHTQHMYILAHMHVRVGWAHTRTKVQACLHLGHEHLTGPTPTA